MTATSSPTVMPSNVPTELDARIDTASEEELDGLARLVVTAAALDDLLGG